MNAKQILIATLGLLAFTPLVRAETVTQTNSFSGTPRYEFSRTNVFDKYTLSSSESVTQIVIQASLDLSGFSLMVTNLDYRYAVTLTSYAMGAQDTVTVIPTGSSSLMVATNAANPNYVIPKMGSVTFNGTHLTQSFTQTITNSSEINQFLGSGTFNVTHDVAFVGQYNTTGNGSPSGTWGIMPVSGNVIVSFFTAIPEPSTWAMLLTAGSAAGLWLRNRKNRRG